MKLEERSGIERLTVMSKSLARNADVGGASWAFRGWISIFVRQDSHGASAARTEEERRRFAKLFVVLKEGKSSQALTLLTKVGDLPKVPCWMGQAPSKRYRP